MTRMTPVSRGVLAAAADNQVPGVDAVRVGAPLSLDSNGVMREGPMVIPQLAHFVVERIALAVHNSISSESTSHSVAQSASGRPATLADDLLMRFVGQATNGAPEVCTYGWAYRALIAAKYDRFSQAYARQVIDLAARTRPRELPGLGPVRLDAFIVSKKDRYPSDGHWPTAQYDREEWARVLGNATLLD